MEILAINYLNVGMDSKQIVSLRLATSTSIRISSQFSRQRANLVPTPVTSIRYADQKGSATVLSSVQSAGVTPEVNLRQGSTQARESTLALKPRVDVTRNPK